MIRIGTRDSQLAVWQATQVKDLLEKLGTPATLELIRSEGDLDLVTPLYAMGVQGVFTRALDSALLNNKIDVAVHSMKDVPVQLPEGIVEAAVLERASYNDILVLNPNWKAPDQSVDPEALRSPISDLNAQFSILNSQTLTIATSSVRRKAQWLNRFPQHIIENIRGNVNTRLRKLSESNWFGAIFAAAGLERIGLRPANSITLDWMLPAPAQGAIMITARGNDRAVLQACARINHAGTAYCVKAEREFLSALMGGCSTPISSLAVLQEDHLYFKGSVVALDGSEKTEVAAIYPLNGTEAPGRLAAEALLEKGGKAIIAKMNHEQ
ncbi:hydroxymethylbilane synthase [Niabella beijingensis]|uniref:hydroxymethylbilane synthase n=1 Tax=Niabella beijingensis TaxID=2872700 RepID=UPI001CBD0DA9|nr:hydroxymethylbilane synthase [Niabella beijingensis]MBZ4189046.1 hydroxymethylbilane synthase [Niabella beijingensis]